MIEILYNIFSSSSSSTVVWATYYLLLYDNDIEQVNIGGDSAEPNHAMYHI